MDDIAMHIPAGWHSRASSSCVLLALIVGVSGCGGNSNLASASGTITLDGKPLDSAFVTFIPANGGTTTYGRTDSNGRYEMQFSNNQAGAWKGQNRVEIKTGDVGTDGQPGPREKVPTTYNTASTLIADVQSGANTFDFPLESDASKIVQPNLQ